MFQAGTGKSPPLVGSHKPAEDEWETLKKLQAWHITDYNVIDLIHRTDHEVYLKPSKQPIVNAHTFFRPAVYFFKGNPKWTDVKMNLSGHSADFAIIINMSDMNRSRIRISRYDGVIMHLGEYRGKGQIIPFKKEEY